MSWMRRRKGLVDIVVAVAIIVIYEILIFSFAFQKDITREIILRESTLLYEGSRFDLYIKTLISSLHPATIQAFFSASCIKKFPHIYEYARYEDEINFPKFFETLKSNATEFVKEAMQKVSEELEKHEDGLTISSDFQVKELEVRGNEIEVRLAPITLRYGTRHFNTTYQISPSTEIETCFKTIFHRAKGVIYGEYHSIKNEIDDAIDEAIEECGMKPESCSPSCNIDELKEKISQKVKSKLVQREEITECYNLSFEVFSITHSLDFSTSQPKIKINIIVGLLIHENETSYPKYLLHDVCYSSSIIYSTLGIRAKLLFSYEKDVCLCPPDEYKCEDDTSVHITYYFENGECVKEEIRENCNKYDEYDCGGEGNVSIFKVIDGVCSEGKCTTIKLENPEVVIECKNLEWCTFIETCMNYGLSCAGGTQKGNVCCCQFKY